jgi:hypothetical protein
MQLYISGACRQGQHGKCENKVVCMCPCHKKEYRRFAQVHRKIIAEEGASQWKRVTAFTGAKG